MTENSPIHYIIHYATVNSSILINKNQGLIGTIVRPPPCLTDDEVCYGAAPFLPSLWYVNFGFKSKESYILSVFELSDGLMLDLSRSKNETGHTWP